MTRRANSRASRRAGFTLIEVMVALIVMTVGSMALIGLQGQTLRQTRLAREFSTATAIAQMWSDRLRTDALMWTEVAPVGGTPGEAQVLANTQYLKNVVGQNGQRFQPLTATVGGATYRSTGFTLQGWDLTGASPTASDVHFCADVRLVWIYYGRAMRADVRVFWPKLPMSINGDQGMAAEFVPAGCSPNSGQLAPNGSRFRGYHTVYMPNVLRVTELEG